MKQKLEYDPWLAELLQGARAEHVTGQLVLHLKNGTLVSADWVLRNVQRKVLDAANKTAY
jgi:hypothetical protein